jgi:preprotein translocase subunit SecD
MRMHTILLSVCLVSFGSLLAGASSSVSFQVRLVAEKSSSDSETMTYVVKRDGKEQKETLQVRKDVLLDQASVACARVVESTESAIPEIEITLSQAGWIRFAEITRENMRKRLAVVINGRVCSAPLIMGEISGGSFRVACDCSLEDALAIANQLTPPKEEQKG